MVPTKGFFSIKQTVSQVFQNVNHKEGFGQCSTKGVLSLHVYFSQGKVTSFLIVYFIFLQEECIFLE